MLLYVFQCAFYFFTCAVTVLYFFFRHKYGYWKKRGVSYEKPTMFVGNLSFLMRTSISEAFLALNQKNKRDYLGIYLSWKPTLIIQSKEYARQILVKDNDCFVDRYSYSGRAEDPLGSLNLFSLKSPVWKQMRADITPMFTTMRLKGLTELMNLNSVELVNKIQRDYIAHNKPVDVKTIFGMYTSDTVAFTVFGIRVSALKEGSSPLWTITGPMMEWTLKRGIEFSTILLIPFIAKTLRQKLFSQEGTDYVRKLFWNVAGERRKTGKSSDKDLVNHLLKLKDNLKLPAGSGAQFADDLMLAQAALFIFAAIETSSITLLHCLHELSHNPDKQEKLFNEIDKTMKSSGKEVLGYEELASIKYLTACIQETLRKYPPVPFLDRLCNKTVKLNDEVTIEKGTPVFVNVIGIHHNEDYFPEPGKWLPERFDGKSETDNLDFTLLPFGEGPRNCIGLRYGLMQVRSAIAHMLPKYKLEPVEPYKINADPYNFLLSPKSGFSMRFIPR
ncbi:cytochrome P450 6k1-like [Trichoplusia ni]|uniref:unspecific monooxygenase n=1 Tax=Trichoplusia ni TaxID=7111 RepID=A0A7E5VC97_TRINI|nr:cytochrome P450 6k1-like [Trichoplusia ni]